MLTTRYVFTLIIEHTFFLYVFYTVETKIILTLCNLVSDDAYMYTA